MIKKNTPLIEFSLLGSFLFVSLLEISFSWFGTSQSFNPSPFSVLHKRTINHHAISPRPFQGVCKKTLQIPSIEDPINYYRLKSHNHLLHSLNDINGAN